MAEPNLDPPAVITALVTAVIGNQALAEVLGPYSIIVIGAMVGASFSTSGEETLTWGQTILHLTKVLGLALIATVPLSMLVIHWFPYIESRWVFGPMSILVGARNKQLPQDVKLLVVWLKTYRTKDGEKKDE